MAYKTKELEKIAIEMIEKHKLFFTSDLITYLPCSKQTFYDHELDQLDSIKTALEKNKVEIKVALRKKWYQSDNPTVQIALYKLIADDDEGDRLNSQKIKAAIETEESKTVNITISGEEMDLSK